MTVSVKNAADEKQVRQAASNDEFKRDVEIRDLIDVLSTKQGRRVMWRIMEWSGCEGTPFRQTNELTYMAIGSGDVGRFIKSEIISAGEQFLFTMMKENQEIKGDSDGRRNSGRNSGSGNSKGGDSDDRNSDDGNSDDGDSES